MYHVKVTLYSPLLVILALSAFCFGFVVCSFSALSEIELSFPQKSKLICDLTAGSFESRPD